MLHLGHGLRPIKQKDMNRSFVQAQSRLYLFVLHDFELFVKRGLQFEIPYVMIVRAVTLIALKCEVAAYERCRFSMERMSS